MASLLDALPHAVLESCIVPRLSMRRALAAWARCCRATSAMASAALPMATRERLLAADSDGVRGVMSTAFAACLIDDDRPMTTICNEWCSFLYRVAICITVRDDSWVHPNQPSCQRQSVCAAHELLDDERPAHTVAYRLLREMCGVDVAAAVAAAVANVTADGDISGTYAVTDAGDWHLTVAHWRFEHGAFGVALRSYGAVTDRADVVTRMTRAVRRALRWWHQVGAEHAERRQRYESRIREHRAALRRCMRSFGLIPPDTPTSREPFLDGYGDMMRTLAARVRRRALPVADDTVSSYRTRVERIARKYMWTNS